MEGSIDSTAAGDAWATAPSPSLAWIAAASACDQVFSFPRSRACITTPRSSAASRKPETADRVGSLGSLLQDALRRK